ncbi:MAG: PAS domain-containing protein [Alphaproteobacteria bacterium]|nr:PAS domain-containing protein [Alphaproteobacteria bacterium]
MSSTDWHPNIQMMMDHWLSLHPRGALPGRQHLEPLKIPQFLANIRLIEVHGPPYRFRVRLMGTALVEFCKRDHTGEWMDDLYPNFAASETYADYHRVISERRAGWRRGTARLFEPVCDSTFERLILPFAKDGRTVDMLLIYTEFLDP